jgi:hypothetical protein
LTPPPPHDPNSIDYALMMAARRRQIRERLSVVCVSVLFTAMVATFYRILTT